MRVLRLCVCCDWLNECAKIKTFINHHDFIFKLVTWRITSNLYKLADLIILYGHIEFNKSQLTFSLTKYLLARMINLRFLFYLCFKWREGFVCYSKSSAVYKMGKYQFRLIFKFYFWFPVVAKRLEELSGFAFIQPWFMRIFAIVVQFLFMFTNYFFKNNKIAKQNYTCGWTEERTQILVWCALFSNLSTAVAMYTWKFSHTFMEKKTWKCTSRTTNVNNIRI